MALLILNLQYIISDKTTEQQVGKDFRDHIQSDLNLKMEKLRLDRWKNLIQVIQPISFEVETSS